MNETIIKSKPVDKLSDIFSKKFNKALNDT